MTKKHIKRLCFVLVLALGVAACTCALAQSFGVVSGTNSLNLRSQGSSASTWLGSYPRGTWVEIVGSQNNFYRVYTPDGRTGYMSKNYINCADDDAYSRIAVVNNHNGGAFLNFRSAPNYSSQVLDIFYNGVPLYVHSYANGWYCVEINGDTGYVRSEFVDVLGSYPASTAVSTVKTPNNTAINMRSGPGMNYPVVRQFSGDSYVMVLSKGTGWSRVFVDGYIGFMSNDFLCEGLCAAKDEAAYKPTVNAAPYAVVSNPVATQALNLRQQPSTASAVLCKLYNGRRLWVNNEGAEWCAVTDQTTGVSGYVMTRYITIYNSQARTRTVYHPNGSYVNLRSAASMFGANILTRVPSGSKVTILSPGTDWCKVSYNGYTGYMMTYFLK